MLPSLTPDRSQLAPHAGAWLTAMPGEPATTWFPPVMQVALRRRLRLPLPITTRHCGSHGCGGSVDAYGDHALKSRIITTAHIDGPIYINVNDNMVEVLTAGDVHKYLNTWDDISVQILDAAVRQKSNIGSKWDGQSFGNTVIFLQTNLCPSH